MKRKFTMPLSMDRKKMIKTRVSDFHNIFPCTAVKCSIGYKYCPLIKIRYGKGHPGSNTVQRITVMGSYTEMNDGFFFLYL